MGKGLDKPTQRVIKEMIYGIQAAKDVARNLQEKIALIKTEELLCRNLSNEDFVVQNGERIAQLIIAKHERANWIEVQELSQTERGEGGFGSTGVK